MTQLSFSDALAAKVEGLSRVETAHATLLARLRTVARTLAAMDGTVHVDDIRAWAETHRITIPRPVYGAIFRGPEWERAGERASTYKANHGHRSPIWRRRA